MRTWSRHKSDTVDLLECGFAAARELERRLAQWNGSRRDRRFAQHAHGLAREAEIASPVVHDQQLADRLAALVAGAAALRAAAPAHEEDRFLSRDRGARARGHGPIGAVL